MLLLHVAIRNIAQLAQIAVWWRGGRRRLSERPVNIEFMYCRPRLRDKLVRIVHGLVGVSGG